MNLILKTLFYLIFGAIAIVCAFVVGIIIAAVLFVVFFIGLALLPIAVIMWLLK